MPGIKFQKNRSFQKCLIIILIQFFVVSTNATSQVGYRYLDDADEALLLGDYDKAITNYLKGTNYVEKNYVPKVWDDLGYAYLQQEKYSNAVKYLKNSISAHPENFNARLYLAVAYLLLNELKLASDELDQIEKNIYFDQSWLSDAKNFQLLNENGDQISIHELERLKKEKGVYFHKNREESESRIKAVVYIDAFNETNEAALHFLRDCIHKKLGDSQKFERIGEISFEIQHRLKDHKNSLLGHKFQQSLDELKKGKIAEAITALEEAMIIDEKSFTINHNLGLLYFDEFQLDPEEMGKLEKAELYCARALWFRKCQTVKTEEIIGCYDLMANIYSVLMEYDKSLREYKKILEFDPQNAHAHYNLGIVYFNIKDYQSAENEWLYAIQLEKETQNQEGDKGTPGKKMDHTVTVRKRSISHLSHLALGNLYLKQEQIEKAISELEMAISIRPNAADPHLSIAKAYQKRGDKRKALSHLERYLFLGGKDEKEAKELMRQLKRW
jgi:tetratricopeptide (TPR) repeat protein